MPITVYSFSILSLRLEVRALIFSDIDIPLFNSMDPAWVYDIHSDQKPLTTTGGHVWPAAKRFAEFLERESSSLGMTSMGTTVLELGSGVGWLGITIARNLPDLACMLMTEQEHGEGVSWLLHNLEINQQMPNVARSVSVAPCDWEIFINTRNLGGGLREGDLRIQHVPQDSTPQIDDFSSSSKESTVLLPAHHRCLLPASSVGRLNPVTGLPWDFIIGSDLIYTEVGSRMLPQVMQALATRGHTQIYYCHTKHRLVLQLAVGI